MSKELTFEEIEIGLHKRSGNKSLSTTEWIQYIYWFSLNKFLFRKKYPSEELAYKTNIYQLYLFAVLRILADYFNGENNWVPEKGECRCYIEYVQDRKEPIVNISEEIILQFTPPFKNDSMVIEAIGVIERDFPELIESFTKKK